MLLLNKRKKNKSKVTTKKQGKETGVYVNLSSQHLFYSIVPEERQKPYQFIFFFTHDI